jgi:formylmethanofuran dehydrogenase subunit E
MPEGELLRLEPVSVRPGWLERRRVRVTCAACGEGVNYEREVTAGRRTLCRACAGECYYTRAADA